MLESRVVLATFTDIGILLENPGDPGPGKVAWGDFDNDGWVDLHGDGIVWHNEGGSFSLFQALTSFGGDGVWGDYDNDGFLDMSHGDRLYRNQEGTGFEEVSSLIPSSSLGNSRAAAWGDFNGDSYLDLFIGGYAVGNSYPYEPDALLINNQGQNFTLAWQESGTIRAGRGVTAADFDVDGDLDVYVSNYRLQPNYLFENDGQGNITDTAGSHGAQGGNGHSIGAAWGDMDNDGHIDLFAGNFAHRGQPESQFLKNLGPAGGFDFQDQSGSAGLGYQESYASPSLADYDNDGDLDLFLTTVYTGDHSVLYRNNGSWNFSDVTGSEGLSGLGKTYMNAWADFDNDGDLDLAADGRIFRNNESGNNWLKVHLEGDGHQVNRSAIGAQVRASFQGMVLTRQVEAGTGQGNQNDLTLHFGLGNYGDTVSLEVFWPDGTSETTQVTPNQTITLAFGQPPTVPGPLSASSVQPFQATVNWGESTDPDGDLVSYELQYKKEGVSEPWSSSIVTTSTSHILTDLGLDTTYWVRVRASDGEKVSAWTDQGADLVMDLNAAFASSFDGNGNIWSDLTPNGNHAEAQDFVPDLASHWVDNSKFDMGGFASGRHFTVPSFSNLDDTIGSFEFWIDSKAAGGGFPQNIFSFGEDERLTINDNQYEWRNGTSVFKGPDNDPSAGPRQLVVTHDGMETKLYLDGIEVNSAASPFWLDDSSKDFRIGATISQTGWPGFLHVARYYDAPLTPAEIEHNFATGLLGTDYKIQAGAELFTTLSFGQPPTVPGSISASNVQALQATVSWGASTDPDGDRVSYELQYKKDGVSEPWSSSIATTSTSYVLTELALNTTYWVRVRASDGENVSPWTDQGSSLVMDLNAAFASSFDGNGNVWSDLTPNGNHAEAQNFVPDLASHWVDNSKFDMGGFASGRHFTVPSFSNLDDANGSFEFWIDSNSATGGAPQNIFSFGEDQRLTINDNQYEWRNGTSIFKGPTNVPDAGPRQLVVTHDGLETKLYLNSIEVNSAASSFWLDDSSQDFRIGATVTQTGWPGFLHVARYYDAPLTPAEIEESFSAGLLEANYLAGQKMFTTLPEPLDEFDIGEVGRVTNLTHEAQTVMLEQQYRKPVVFAHSASLVGADPVSVRVTDVQLDRFTIYLSEPSNLNGLHNAAETVTYVVLEAGMYQLVDGTQLEVGTVMSDATVGRIVDNEWESVDFATAFSAIPVVLSQIQTTAGEAYLETRQNSVTTNGFQLALEQEENNGSQHGLETIGYLAMEPGSGAWNGMLMEAHNTPSSVTEAWFTQSFDWGYAETPALLTSLTSYNGIDNAHVRYTNLTTTSVQLKIGEDTTADTETGHAEESVAYLAIGGEGRLTALVPQVEIGKLGRVTNLTHVEQTIFLDHDFTDPVVFAQSASLAGIAPVSVRVTDIQSDRFTIYLTEPSNENGLHNAAETVSYLVLESGSHRLADGTQLEVGTVTTGATVGQIVSNQWELVNFSRPFDSAPVVLSQIQTTYGQAYLQTRQMGVGPSEFQLAVEQEENVGTQHVSEKVGYLAIEAGVGIWSGLIFEAFNTPKNVTESLTDVNFVHNFQIAPRLLSSLTSYVGSDNAHIRYDNLMGSGVQFKIGEDTTRDAETAHVAENVAYLAIGGEGVLTAILRQPPPRVSMVERDSNSGTFDTLDTLAFTFDQGVNIGITALTLLNDTSGSTSVDLANVGFNYHSELSIGRWDFTSIVGITPAWYTAVLKSTSITNLAGSALDADGDGSGGDDYLHTFLVAERGDSDLDTDVDITDVIQIVTEFDPLSANSSNDWLKGDFDSDADVDIGDFNTLVGNYAPFGYIPSTAARLLSNVEEVEVAQRMSTFTANSTARANTLVPLRPNQDLSKPIASSVIDQRPVPKLIVDQIFQNWELATNFDSTYVRPVSRNSLEETDDLM